MKIKLMFCPTDPAFAPSVCEFDRLPIVVRGQGPFVDFHVEGVNFVIARASSGDALTLHPLTDHHSAVTFVENAIIPLGDVGVLIALRVDLSEETATIDLDVANKMAMELQDALAELHHSAGFNGATSHREMYENLCKWIRDTRSFESHLHVILKTYDRATILSDIELEQRGRLEGERWGQTLDVLCTLAGVDAGKYDDLRIWAHEVTTVARTVRQPTTTPLTGPDAAEHQDAATAEIVNAAEKRLTPLAWARANLEPRDVELLGRFLSDDASLGTLVQHHVNLQRWCDREQEHQGLDLAVQMKIRQQLTEALGLSVRATNEDIIARAQQAGSAVPRLRRVCAAVLGIDVSEVDADPDVEAVIADLWKAPRRAVPEALFGRLLSDLGTAAAQALGLPATDLVYSADYKHDSVISRLHECIRNAATARERRVLSQVRGSGTSVLECETDHTAEVPNNGSTDDDMRETLRQTRQDAANMEDQIEALTSQNAVLTRLLAGCLGVSEAADLVEVAECVIHARGEGAGPLENTVLELRKARRVIETITKTLCNI